MCGVHEAEWWARHGDALARHVAENQPKPAPKRDNEDLL
jgi:hypothetical protein